MWIEKLKNHLHIHKAIALSLPLIERLNALQVFSHISLPSYFWSLTTPGISRLNYSAPHSVELITEFNGALLERTKEAIAFIRDYPAPGLFILENLQALINSKATSFLEQEELIAHLVDTVCTLHSERLVSSEVEISRRVNSCDDKFLVLLDVHEIGLPQTLNSLIPTLTYPLPSSKDISAIIESLNPNLDEATLNQLQLTCAGLTIEEIKIGFRRVGDGDNPATVLLDYKIERLKALGLDFIPKPSVGDFGGLDRIKTGIEEVRTEFMEVARRYKIPYPKGWLLAGVPGTGKTFCSQICAQILGFPLISVGADVVKGGGAGFLKRLLTRIEACSPAVCFFDEFDKFFAADSSTGEDKQSKQILGILLTWLQEKRSPTFVIATLNRLDALPPELTRAGRFDKIFYVGFPQSVERKEIFQLHASRFDPRWQSDETCPLTHSDWMILLGKTQNCTGAEIRAIVEGAAKRIFHSLYESLGLKQETLDSLPLAVSEVEPPIELGLEQLLLSRSEITSLFSRDPERVLAMENRAKYVAVEASSPDTSSFAPPLTSYWGD
ncbi:MULTISPECIES: ATP-binding protein [unclassified Coleofasciculus]|uniref:ATP-binding protein n=1 Tax=unclassified Coleofasciculus TaxID=2692782 RepID=UPI00187F024E|nr:MULTISPECIES: AAA family ATPase [unclassified Coleofasciculus]MBE9128012.1 AAA family ATPase [Coleofasciculus sp. LEGE 07081]MBE9150547.1 AAA family ATPase [Coleofasciculus sp. LEGE 07092]